VTGVCFVDTETLGLDADYQPIWEVGLIDAVGTEHHWFLKVTPREISLAHPKALGMGGFVERYERPGATHPSVFAHQFAGMVDSCHLAGAVVSFDEERIRRLCWTHGAPVTWHYHIIDVEPLAVGFLARADSSAFTQDDTNPLRPPWDSNALSLAVGVNPKDFDRHTAIGDCRWAKAIYEAVLGTK
jgi:hypothetical protein